MCCALWCCDRSRQHLPNSFRASAAHTNLPCSGGSSSSKRQPTDERRKGGGVVPAYSYGVRSNQPKYPQGSLGSSLLGSLFPRRVLQQLHVDRGLWQLHVSDHGAADEAVLHGLHVRELVGLYNADIEELDVEVLVD
eukprot:CAMPEP_0179902604 /NCGR_PEP_ID=MMETSP0982-20121206/40659_1 /TAXON_ID=483367 /ORGANISM="non described non described, Strain CCMP 2436" /LENGTH=136 /DNA_ID=CAMNT_0021801775 /DNA_START=155 /DNA_END=566 /DNA_ORIENTATION=+